MRDLRNQYTIWEFVGGLSAVNGLVCFALSSTYKISFGKLGIIGGRLFYLLLSSTMLYLIWRVKRVEIEERFQGHVKALIFIVICSLSVMLDKLVPGKSDALSIISYGSFALMSLSMSRKCELGFETGFFSFFLSLFSQQLCKINLKLSPIALLFCLVVFILRHYSESSEVQSGSITPNAVHPIEVGPPNEAIIEIGDEGINEVVLKQSQDSSGIGEILGESPVSRWTRARRRAAKLVVRVIEAKNLPPTDLNGLSDPYVRIRLGRQKFKTRVVKKSLNPKWDEEFSFMVDDLTEELQFSVLSEDKYFNDDFLGHLNVPLLLVFEEELKSLGTAWYSLHPKSKKYKNKECGEIRLSIYFAQNNSSLDWNNDSSEPLLSASNE